MAKGVLKDELIADLRSTHYKLGYDTSMNNQTSNQSVYIPHSINYNEKSNMSKEIRKNNFNFNPTKSLQNNKTIYTTDYTKKEIFYENY